MPDTKKRVRITLSRQWSSFLTVYVVLIAVVKMNRNGSFAVVEDFEISRDVGVQKISLLGIASVYKSASFLFMTAVASVALTTSNRA